MGRVRVMANCRPVVPKEEMRKSRRSRGKGEGEEKKEDVDEVEW